MKGFFKQILAIAAVLGICGGIVWYFQNEQNEKMKNDESYKVVTSRDKSYNGVYTLTKLDKNGKNTWNGLIMYVKNDKIISCVLVEFESYDYIRKNYLKGDKDVPKNKLINYSKLSAGRINQSTGFLSQPDGGLLELNNGGIIAGQTGCVYYEHSVNLKKDYSNLKKMELIAGYDEKSQEIWLSKLLNNKKSLYKNNYKLIHYKDYWDVSNNCKIDDGFCITRLNNLFNANLETND